MSSPHQETVGKLIQAGPWTVVNANGANGFTLDVQVWDNRQARYLVHGLDDSLWTDDIAEVAAFISVELARIEANRP